jgi:hypothetical protein
VFTSENILNSYAGPIDAVTPADADPVPPVCTDVIASGVDAVELARDAPEDNTAYSIFVSSSSVMPVHAIAVAVLNVEYPIVIPPATVFTFSVMVPVDSDVAVA